MRQGVAREHDAARVRGDMTDETFFHQLEQPQKHLFDRGIFQDLIEHSTSFARSVRSEVAVISAERFAERVSQGGRDTETTPQVLHG